MRKLPRTRRNAVQKARSFEYRVERGEREILATKEVVSAEKDACGRSLRHGQKATRVAFQRQRRTQHNRVTDQVANHSCEVHGELHVEA